ncbi:tripartite tricarboxylate transporter TctB family protein [Gemmobacter serpentinus]|uniref:tripartite tricarboxylate transporter TctB family protein n=1 Tax=Gemmobacter serpentinus TaxID=2652247 RepID=UPI00186577F3|nr:tripartite tricarboxylate transporter TctB family protein [Gemmobacter serpentinus]
MVFAYAATHLGFVIASPGLIIVGSLADPGVRWRQVLALAIGLTLFGAQVFVWGLGVQVPLWPPFLPI